MAQRTIIIVKDDNSEKSYLLESFNKDVIMMGKAQDCDIRVDSNKASEYHGCFYKKDNEWYYQDNNSTFGSSVNGSRITSTVLNNGLKIVLDSSMNTDASIVDVMIDKGSPQNGGYFDQKQSGYINNYSNGGQSGYNVVNDGQLYRTDQRFNTGTIYRQQEYSGPSYNVWGIVAGAVWAVIGIVGIVNLIRSFGILQELEDITRASSGGGLAIILMIICFIAAVVGTVIITIALLWNHDKKTMCISAYLIAYGYMGIIVAIILLLAIIAEGNFGALFESSNFVMLIFAAVLQSISLILLARCFNKNNNKEKIYNGIYVPIICFAIAWILVMIMVSSNGSILTSRSNAKLTILDYLPLFSIWMSIAWTAAVVFSCVYLHVDEVPYLSERFSINRYGTGYGNQYFMQNNNQYSQNNIQGQGYNQYSPNSNGNNYQNYYNNPFGKQQ